MVAAHWQNRMNRMAAPRTVSPAVQAGPLAAQVAQARAQQQQQRQSNKPAWQQALDGNGAPPVGVAAKQPGGVKGFLGTVLGSTPAQAALTPLKFLDVPGRTFKSTLNELADVFNGGDASFDDWKAQIRDEEFGFGDMTANTGNKWLDRGIGFIGDVALDPLTYVSFGAGKFAGGAGRAAAASQLASKGAPASVVRQVGRLGVNTLDDEWRRVLGAGDKGLRFMGNRIPGTGGVADKVGGTLSRTGARIGDTRAAQAVTGRVGEETLKDARRVLQGRAPGDPIAAAARIYASDSMRMGTGVFANQFAQQAKQWDTLPKSQRKAITHAIEAGADENGAKFFDALFEELQNAGATGVKRRENYVLHQRTPQFVDWANQADDGKKFLRTDSGDSAGRAFERQFQPGESYVIDGQRVTLETASIKEINEKIGAILGFDVLEDDIAKLARTAVGTSAQDAGLAAAIRELREKFPQLARLQDEVPTQQVLDKQGTKAAHQGRIDDAQQIVNDLAGDVRAGTKGVADLTREAKQAAVDGLQTRVGRLRTVSKSIKDDIKEAGKAITAARNNREAIESAVRRPRHKLTRELRALKEELRIQQGISDASDGVALRSDETVRAAGVERRVGRRRSTRELERAIVEHEQAARELDELLDGAAAAGRGDVATRGALVDRTGERVRAIGDELAEQSGPIGARLENEGFADELGRLNAEGVAQAEDAVTAAQRRLDDLVETFEGDREAAVQAMFAEQGWLLDNQDALARIEQDINQAVADRLAAKNIKTGTKAELEQAVEELRTVSAQLDGTPEGEVVKNLLLQRNQMLADTNMAQFNLSNARAMRDSIKSGEMQPVLMDAMANGWNQIGKQLLGDEDATFVVDELRQHFTRVAQHIQDPDWAKVLDQYTQFFKTYATMTPGFHIRNGMSASFMNFTEGVGPQTQLEAFRTFRAIRKDPKKWLASASPAEKDAMRAMYGSGAGGSFNPSELGEGVDRLTNNMLTRLSRRMGEWVEGPARYALALDTTMSGGSAQEALARVTRVQFDYSQLSQFDRKMKRIIPFWTFMSRNLPLQMQQMWMKPRAYAIYDHFKDNFDAEGDGNVIPQWWQEQGAFNTGLKVGGNEVFAMPDLPHTRLQEEVEKLGDPKRFLSQATPLGRVPAEFMFNEKLYSGNEFYDDENKFLYALTNMVPGAAQADRLSGGGVTAALGANSDYRKENQAQSIASWLGIPARQLTPEIIERELRRLAREGQG